MDKEYVIIHRHRDNNKYKSAIVRAYENKDKDAFEYYMEQRKEILNKHKQKRATLDKKELENAAAAIADAIESALK